MLRITAPIVSARSARRTLGTGAGIEQRDARAGSAAWPIVSGRLVRARAVSGDRRISNREHAHQQVRDDHDEQDPERFRDVRRRTSAARGTAPVMSCTVAHNQACWPRRSAGA